MLLHNYDFYDEAGNFDRSGYFYTADAKRYVLDKGGVAYGPYLPKNGYRR